MNIVKWMFFIIVGSNIGCGDSEDQILEKFNILRKEVEQNYKNNFNTFNGLKRHFKLRYVKYIAFHGDDRVTVKAKYGNDWRNIEGPSDGDSLKEICETEGLSAFFFEKLKQQMDSLNTNILSLTDIYDVRRGTYTQAFEIQYKTEVNGLHFYYKVFSEPLDSVPGLYSIDDKVGGVLDKNVIYYYR